MFAEMSLSILKDKNLQGKIQFSKYFVINFFTQKLEGNDFKLVSNVIFIFQLCNFLTDPEILIE